MELILPYPEMEFTPLDILSASDMNQILANQEYLKEHRGEIYTAGDGLLLAENQFSINTDVVAQKSDLTSLATKSEVAEQISEIELTPGPAGPAGEQGKPGEPGKDGENGKSAYEIWKEQDGNSDKSIEEFLSSLKGADGEDADPYTLPPASKTTLGGVKIGDGIDVTADGTISSKATGYSYATEDKDGLMTKGDVTFFQNYGVMSNSSKGEATADSYSLKFKRYSKVRDVWNTAEDAVAEIPAATSSSAGAMPASDKAFLDNAKAQTLNQDGTLKDDIVKTSNIDWGSVEYSKTKQVIGKLPDGRKVYRKFFEGTHEMKDATKAVLQLNVGSLGFIMNYGGSFSISSGSFLCLPWTLSSWGVTASVYRANGYLACVDVLFTEAKTYTMRYYIWVDYVEA